MTSIDVIASALGDEQPELGAMSSPDGALTLLFCDIEDAAQIGGEIGAERTQELLRDHRVIVEQVVTHHGGTVVKAHDDGFMVAFDSAHAALRCAVELQRSLADRTVPGSGRPLRLRIGLHTGFVIAGGKSSMGATSCSAPASRVARGGADHRVLVGQGVHGDRPQLPVRGPRRATLQGSARRTHGVLGGELSAMAQNIYITAMGPNSGKSVVALGFTEMLSARLERVGFFRPVIRGGDEADPQIELMRDRYQLQSEYARMHGPTADVVTGLIAHGEHEEIEKRVLVAFKELERDCDFVVCEGSDFLGSAPALDFDLNANLANQLGCPVLVVVNAAASGDVVEEVQLARELLQRKQCELFGVIVNRVAPDAVQEVETRLAPHTGEEWVYVMPEHPELSYPTVEEIRAGLDARVVAGADGQHPDGHRLDRDVRAVRVAAMSAEHFIDDLVDGTLVVVPADRSDIVLACLACTLSPSLPAVAGMLLTGGYELSDTVSRLLEAAPFPVLQTDERTYAAAAAIPAVTPVLRADNERRIATALGVFERSVDKVELLMRFTVERPARMTPTMFEYELIERAKSARRHIVLPEGEDDRVLRAADILLRRGVVALTVLGDPDAISARAAALGLDLSEARLLDPLRSPERERYGGVYHELRKHKGLTEEGAYDALGDNTYYGTMMVHLGDVDGMVSGAAHTTGDTIRPAFEFIKSRPGVSVVSSVFFMCLSDRVLVYGDCAVNPKPGVEQLADIAISSADTAAAFGIEPRIAMLSYATGDSAKGEQVDAVREATETVRRLRGDLKVDGPLQYDAAVDTSVAKLKLPDSDVAGSASVFIFPDLDTGNIAYKAVQRSSGALAIGPVLQGLRRPVNDLSRGCAVTDIVNTVAITAIQAQEPS